MIKTMRLDTILKEHGWVNDEQIQMGLVHQERSGCRWGTALIELGIINETLLTQALCEQHSTPVWDPVTFAPDPAAMALFRAHWQRHNGVLPLTYDPEGGILHLAMRDPDDELLLAEICEQENIKTVIVSAAPEASLQRIWDSYFGPTTEELFTDSQLRVQHTVPNGKVVDGGTILDDAETSGHTGLDAPAPDTLATSGGILLEQLWKAVEMTPQTRVLLWLVRHHLAERVATLLESENCYVQSWDGGKLPEGRWDYLIFDQDNAESHPQALAQLRKSHPDLRLVRRASFAAAMLRTPIPYEQMRNGYLWLAEQSALWLCDNADTTEVSRYANAVSQLCGLSAEASDTIAVACFLEFMLQRAVPAPSSREILLSTLECPYPVADILRRHATTKKGQTVTTGDPIPATVESNIFDVLVAYFQERKTLPITTIEQAAQFGEWLKRNPDRHYDPNASEALLRVIREEILDSYLPPGPSEVLLVGDGMRAWGELPSILKAEGWRVVTSYDDAEARALVKRRRPDAVVWAASDALEWIRWQSRCALGTASFLVMDHSDSELARAAILAGYEDVWCGQWDPVVAAAKLRRAAERRPHPPSRAQTVSGSLAQFNVIDMVQILAAGGRSVRIDISCEKATGRLILWQGQVRFAEAGSLAGEEAFYKILGWHNGTFSCTPIETLAETNCRLSNEAMLLEGCQRLDEEHHAGTLTAVLPD